VSDQRFDNLVNEHGRQVLSTAARILRDTNLAHDVHQEVFLAVWRRWHRYNGTMNWTAYLYRATVRKALELARRRIVRGVPVRASSSVSRASCPRFEDETPSTQMPCGVTTSGPDDAMVADELQRHLAAALGRLPQREADAFILLRLERLETAEVARIMGCAAPTVRVHLHRAVAKLAGELREYLDR
jgi:RNA polymerase sigma factor (sigma-70 family)